VTDGRLFATDVSANMKKPDFQGLVTFLSPSLPPFLFSFFIAGRGPAYYWTSALIPCNGPVP